MEFLSTVFIVGIIALGIFVLYKIVSKMGYPGWYTILFFIPLIGTFFWVYLAFTKWPIEEELERARMNSQRPEPFPEQTPLPPGLPPSV